MKESKHITSLHHDSFNQIFYLLIIFLQLTDTFLFLNSLFLSLPFNCVGYIQMQQTQEIACCTCDE